ncbi:MAG: tetratricopeptide repeat protein, partial [Candidatus Delongbacteria bacterium]|nr:tetratricopeptide repeat protein [Candidatus Delongbacteria bacterium]
SYFSGFRYTSKGISYIEDAAKENKKIGDALLLLGSYTYYKSSLLSWIWDRREKGVTMMKKSIGTSYFSKFLAVSTLGWAYIDYEKYNEAVKTADIALKEYPDSHFFLFLKARALYEGKQYHKSNRIYLKIIDKINSFEEHYSQVDLFNSNYFLAMSYSQLMDSKKARSHYDLALQCKLTASEKDRLEDRFDDLEDVFE